jgi:hypothetical protein
MGRRHSSQPSRKALWTVERSARLMNLHGEVLDYRREERTVACKAGTLSPSDVIRDPRS